MKFRRLSPPEGNNILDEEYYEFYADEEKLDKRILRLFYVPKNRGCVRGPTLQIER